MATARVLIVDDEKDIRDLLARLVGREGYEPHVAADGEEALQKVGAAAPDVMLLDVKMPGLNGLLVLHEARRLQPRLPIVMITSQSGVGDMRAALQAGACGYLVKPFDHGEVLRSVERALGAGGSSEPHPAPGRVAERLGPINARNVVSGAAAGADPGLRELVRRAARAAEYAALVAALTRANGDEAVAARLLQIDSRTIHAKLKTHGLAVPRRSVGGHDG